MNTIIAKRDEDRQGAVVTNLRIPHHRSPGGAILLGIVSDAPSAALAGAREGGAGKVRVGPDSAAKVGGGNIHFTYWSYSVCAHGAAEWIDALDNTARAANPDPSFPIDSHTSRSVFGDWNGADQRAVILQVGHRVAAVRRSYPDVTVGINRDALRPGVTMRVLTDKPSIRCILGDGRAWIVSYPDVTKRILGHAP